MTNHLLYQCKFFWHTKSWILSDITLSYLSTYQMISMTYEALDIKSYCWGMIDWLMGMIDCLIDWLIEGYDLLTDQRVWSIDWLIVRLTDWI